MSEGTGYIKEGAPSWFVWSARSVQGIAGDAVYSILFMELAPGFRYCNNFGRIVVCKGP